MNSHERSRKSKKQRCWRLNTPAVIALSMVLSALLAVAQNSDKPAGKQDKDKKSSGKSVGFILSDDATAKDVGLPIYPGAQRAKDSSDDSPAVQMGLWGGSSGFKLVVLKLESDDSPERIAGFYRKALAHYGRVLDCGGSGQHEKSNSDHSKRLDCDSDHPVPGGFTLKAGTNEKQHVVGIEPKGSHTRIALVYLVTRNSESE